MKENLRIEKGFIKYIDSRFFTHTHTRKEKSKKTYSALSNVHEFHQR
jgi:hypothetical protein